MSSQPELARALMKQARHSIAEVHLPRIVRCLRLLSEEDIWWRPNEVSNSAGNLVLHLAGNVRQWMISGLDRAPDVRDRDREFAERGRVQRRKLLQTLSSTVEEAVKVISKLSARDLETEHVIQGFRVSGLQAVFHVAEHFAFHSGQIQFITKLKRGRDLGFTRLPAGKGKASRAATVKLKSEVEGNELPQI